MIWANGLFDGRSFIMRLNLEMKKNQQEWNGEKRLPTKSPRISCNAVNAKSFRFGYICVGETTRVWYVWLWTWDGETMDCITIRFCVRFQSKSPPPTPTHPQFHTSNNYLFPKVFSSVCVCVCVVRMCDDARSLAICFMCSRFTSEPIKKLFPLFCVVCSMFDGCSMEYECIAPLFLRIAQQHPKSISTQLFISSYSYMAHRLYARCIYIGRWWSCIANTFKIG